MQTLAQGRRHSHSPGDNDGNEDSDEANDSLAIMSLGANDVHDVSKGGVGARMITVAIHPGCL